MSDKEVILVGYSGHGIVVADCAIDSSLNLVYYSELNSLANNPFNLKYIGFEGENLFKGWEGDFEFILGIGDNYLRQKVVELISSKGKNLKNVIHVSASISNSVLIGIGNFVSRNVSVNSLTKIGDCCILNTGCIIDHECTIENLVHIAPGAVLAGNVSIGERSFIGANAVIKQGVNIGRDVIIGAGSVVIRDIPDGQKVVGNPCRLI